MSDFAATVLSLMPFAESIGVRIETATKDEVCGSLEWSESRCTTGGVMHGGALMSLADSLGAVCAFLNIPEGSSTTTVESATRFFRAVRGGAAHATARPVHVGRRFVTVQTDIVGDDGRLAVQVTQTQAVIAPSE
jgi:uncharacterized protein (TIGR00369 family)